MADYRKAFPRRNTLLVVVHTETVKQALRNASVAREGGVDGIFLINHSITAGQLLEIFREVQAQHGDWWIGLNFLDLAPSSAVAMLPDGASGIWLDNGGIVEGDFDPSEQARQVRSIQQAYSGEPLLFGGIAFKYQQRVNDVAHVAQLAAPHMDVVVTSGEGTGIAADIAKIRTMKEAIGEHPLALASGVTVENVGDYLEWVDCFLVATGVSDSHTELNPLKVGALADRIHSSS